MTTASLVLVANAGDGSISTFRFDGDALERIAVTDGLAGTGTFAIDAARDLVYAGVKGDPAAVVTLALDRASGALTERSRLALPGGSLAYVSLARGGTALLGASYGGDYGFIAPVGGDGVVGEPVSTVHHHYLHSVLADSDGRVAHFVSLGDDLVATYAIADDLSLSLLQTAAVPAGAAPRHLVLNAAEDALYVVTEYSGEVLHFDRDVATGTLVLRGAASAIDLSAGLVRGRLDGDPVAERAIWGADLHWGAGESVLWASERLLGTLGALPVDPAGRLTAAEAFTTTEPQPRGFALSGDGRFLVAAGERSTTVSLYAVDGEHLQLRQQVETGRGANWVRFVEG